MNRKALCFRFHRFQALLKPKSSEREKLSTFVSVESSYKLNPKNTSFYQRLFSGCVKSGQSNFRSPVGIGSVCSVLFNLDSQLQNSFTYFELNMSSVPKRYDSEHTWASWPFSGRKSIVIIVVCLLVSLIPAIAGIGCNSSSSCAPMGMNRFGNLTSEDKYCERRRSDRIFQETTNSITSSTYLFVGLLVLCCTAFDASDGKQFINPGNVIVRSPFMSLILGIALIYTGTTSYIMHAYRSERTKFLDFSGALFLSCFVSTYVLTLFLISWRRPKVVYVGLFIIGACFLSVFARNTIFRFQSN